MQTLKEITFTLNQIPFHYRKVVMSDIENKNLLAIREYFSKIILKDHVFVKDGFQIHTDYEADYTLAKIIINNTVNLHSIDDFAKKDSEDKPCPNPYGVEEEIEIKFFLNKNPLQSTKVFIYQVIKKSLNEIRNEFSPLIQNYKFVKEGFPIQIYDEADYTLSEVMIDNIVHLEGIKSTNPINPTKPSIKDDTKPKIPDNISDENVQIKFYLNEEPLLAKKFQKYYIKTKFLEEVRLDFNFIKPEFKFQYDGFVIETEDEANTRMLEILVGNNSIYLKKEININQESYTNTNININKKIVSPDDNTNIIPKIKPKNIPIEGSRFLRQENGQNLYLYPSYKNTIFRNNGKIENKEYCREYKLTEEQELLSLEILVVGQTGSGKTTYLNSLINFIMGVQIEDDFRYVIIDENAVRNQAHSQTKNVTIYHIHPNKDIPPMIIVDTPGFGDTDGFEMDKIVTELIDYAFIKILKSITAVCFVAQASNVRLTINQKFIFNKVMELFGKDIAENFIATITFCDNGEPAILAALQEEGSVFDKIIDKIKPPWYLKFNNSAFFEKYDKSSRFSGLFWEVGYESFNTFITKLKYLPRKSLSLSKEVLAERKALENTIITIRPILDQGLLSMETIRIIQSEIDKDTSLINSSKNFTMTIASPKIDKIDLEQGIYTTTCLTCSFTCHSDCVYSDDKDKKNCCAMDKSGNCTNCQKKCSWDTHKNLPYIFKYSTVNKVVTQKDLEERYYNSLNQKTKREQILLGLRNEFNQVLIRCYDNQERIRTSVNRLKEIALNSNVLNDSEEYLEMMIISEQSEKKPGFMSRIASLKELISKSKLIKEAYNRTGQLETFKIFQQKYLNEEINTKQKTNTKKSDFCFIF